MALWLLKSILRYLFCGDSWEHAFTVTDLICPTSHILGYEIEPLISLSEQLNSPSEQSNSLPVAKERLQQKEQLQLLSRGNGGTHVNRRGRLQQTLLRLAVLSLLLSQQDEVENDQQHQRDANSRHGGPVRRSVAVAIVQPAEEQLNGNAERRCISRMQLRREG